MALASMTFMAHKKLWHTMTNIGAINSRHIEIQGVKKDHGLLYKFVTHYFQMACHVIITWKTKSNRTSCKKCN
jgi:hypothetical protein